MEVYSYSIIPELLALSSAATHLKQSRLLLSQHGPSGKVGAETPDLFLIVNMCKRGVGGAESASGSKTERSDRGNQDSDIKKQPGGGSGGGGSVATGNNKNLMLGRSRPPAYVNVLEPSCVYGHFLRCVCKLILSRGRQMGEMCF